MRQWVSLVGARTAFIEPGSPAENGYIESFTRDELLNVEIFYHLKEAQVLIVAGPCHLAGGTLNAQTFKRGPLNRGRS